MDDLSQILFHEKSTSYAHHMFFNGIVSHLVLAGDLFQRLQYGQKAHPFFLEECLMSPFDISLCTISVSL